MGNRILPILIEQTTYPHKLEEFNVRYRAMSEMCWRYNMTPMRVATPIEDKPAVLWGASQEWVEKACALYGDRHLILKGNPAIYKDFDVNIIGENTADEVRQILEYLTAANRTQIALLGPNRGHFESRYYIRTFLAKAEEIGMPIDETSVFWDTGESEDPTNPRLLEECYENFRKVYKKYNAVICYNTQAAVYLCARAKEEGIRIPEDLYVIGRGDLHLAEVIQPSITTVSLNEAEVGQQIVKLYRYLCNNPSVKSVTVLVNSHIIPRQSTEYFTLPPKKKCMPDDSFLSKAGTSSKPYIEIERLEEFLFSCTEMDIRILDGIRRGVSREKLAEQEITTISTVRYRLNRMIKYAGVESKEELFALLDKYGVDLSRFKKSKRVL